ncbi:MAG: DUF998 domain-containing protein [Lapillicoccus sp.]
MSPSPASHLRPLPLWALVSAFVAPVAYIGGWMYAGAVTTMYDPVRSSVSDLAAGDAPHRWIMTAALVVAGLAYLVTAIGLRPADGAGRTLLGVGGVATLIVAWIPNTHVGHNVVGHMIVTYLAYASLSLWPAVIARNVAGAPLVLRPTFGKTAAIVMGILALVTVADIITGGATLGLRERILTTAQLLVPLVVALGAVRLPSPVAPHQPVHHG